MYFRRHVFVVVVVSATCSSSRRVQGPWPLVLVTQIFVPPSRCPVSWVPGFRLASWVFVPSCPVTGVLGLRPLLSRDWCPGSSPPPVL
ncbi:uncharacterized protein LOC143294299 isoform X2 [Babylonia areolata]|uniref:uncharacterized protein LOC143294299 isoform X2 n=1 Tax=Babylonia areolata TaxID=304850 RepID=UPI003FD47E1E